MTYPNFSGIVPRNVTQPMIRPVIDGIAVYKHLVELGNSGAQKRLSFADGHFQHLTLTANCGITLTAPNEAHAVPSSQYVMRLHVTQGPGGNFTISWPGTTQFADGIRPTLTATAGHTDILELYYANGAWHVSMLAADVQVNSI